MEYHCYDCEDCCVIDVEKTPTCCPCGQKGWKQIVKWEQIPKTIIEGV